MGRSLLDDLDAKLVNEEDARDPWSILGVAGTVAICPIPSFSVVLPAGCGHTTENGCGIIHNGGEIDPMTPYF